MHITQSQFLCKAFEVSFSQSKKSKGLGLAEKIMLVSPCCSYHLPPLYYTEIWMKMKLCMYANYTVPFCCLAIISYQSNPGAPILTYPLLPVPHFLSRPDRDIKGQLGRKGAPVCKCVGIQVFKRLNSTPTLLSTLLLPCYCLPFGPSSV